MSIAFTKEMALAAGLLLLLVFFCTGAYGADANNKLVCEETYFLHYDISAVISCEYERSFLTVRWYFNGAGKSFLRFDGETLQKRGSGYDSGEYDIQDDGSMVIKRTDVKHEGIYKIAVLHSDGSSSQENIAIFIVVPLKSLIIHDCGSRRIELCPGELFEESSDAILCIAKDSWLPVDLEWQTLGPNGIAVDVSSKYTSVHKRDNISSLFTSSSTLQYEKESFVLQKFTCVASDRANKTTLTNSLLVSGDYPPLRSSLAERNVNEGSSFHMKCPVESKPLAQLYVTFFDGISKLLMETNTNTFQQVCVDESCQLKNNNIVVFGNVSHKQEGVYRCISSDGTTAEEHVLDVTVLSSPANAAVNIKGCASNESCKRNGTKPGSLTCSVSGFRPPVELTMTEDDDSKLEVKLTNHRQETTTDPESGTSESYLTVDYAIIGCDGTASLTCSARPDIFARKIKPSKITITTDKVKCMDDPVTEKKGKGGLIAGLLVVFAIIAAIVVFIVIRTRKKGISKSGGKQSEETESRLLPVGQAQMNADETDVEVGGASTNEKKEKQALLSTSENQNADETDVEAEKASFTERYEVAENETSLSKNETDMADTESKDKKKDTKQKKADTTDTKSKDKKKDTKQKKVKTPDKKKNKSTKPKSDKAQKKLQEEFNKKFRAVSEMESQVQKERFKEELDKFIAKHGKENTVRFLGVFVKDKQLQEEELIWILECLELDKEENVKSSTETVEILRIIAEKKQVSEKCLEIAKQQYLQKKITAREFATITSPLRESHKIDELLKSMDVTNTSQKEPSSDAVDALVQYAILKPLDATEKHRNISYIAATNAASKIKYIKIVQAIQERFGEGNSVTELKAFLKTIAEKVLIRENAIFKEHIFKILEDTQPTKEEEITSVFVRMLLFSVEKKLIEIGECMEMLQSGLDKKKLTKSFFTELPHYSQTEGCLSKKFMFQLLREAVIGEKITEVDCFRILEAALNEKQIQISEYMGELTQSVKDNLITKEEMMEELRRCAIENLENEVYYCYQMNYLLENEQLTYKEYTEEIQSSVDNNWVKRSHVVEGLQESLKNKLITEQQLLSQLCQIHVGGKISEHIEALQLSRTKNLISEETLMSQFQELVKKGRLDVTGYINEMRSCLQQDHINETLFLKELRKVSNSGKLNIEVLTSEMKDTLEKKLIGQDAFCENLSDLFKEGKIDQPKIVEQLQVCFEKKWISEDMFLNQLTNLFVNKKMDTNDLMEKLHECVGKKSLKEESFLSHVSSLFIGGKLAKHELMEEYLTCLAEKLISLNVVCEQLRMLLKDKKIETGDYLDTLNFERNLIDITEYNTELKKCVDAKLISNEIYTKQIEQQEEKKKIDFRGAFEALCTEITSDKGTNDKFQEVLKKFHKKYKESPSNYMEEYIDKEDIAEEQLIAVTKFLAGCEESDLFSISDRTKVIRLAVKKLPPETSLSLLAEIFSLHQLTVEEFVAGTKFLLDEKKITAKGILAALKEVSKSKYPGVEIADTIIQFILKNLMNVDEVFRQIGFQGVGKEKIHHPYYLQAIQGIIGDVTVQQKNTLRSLFDKILTKATDNQVIFRDQAINNMKKPDLRKKFLRVLLLNVQNKWIKTDDCIAILTASKQKGQINETDLEDISDCLINQSWLDKVNTMDVLAKCFHASLISESTYKKDLTSFRKKGKITKDELTDALKICAGKNT